jgi:hypothetical protein
MERNKAIGLALIIAGVAGGVIYYMYVMKKPALAPAPKPAPAPNTNITPASTSRNAGLTRKLSVPQVNAGVQLQAATLPLSSGTEMGTGTGNQYVSAPIASQQGPAHLYNASLYQGNLSR